MTVSALAKQLGASKPTIYARVKKAGIEWKDLRDKITGDLTPEAVHIISDLFKDFPSTNKESNDTMTEGQTDGNAAINAQIALLREIIATKDEQIIQLQAQIEALRADIEAWRQRVPIALPTPRPGFWERRRMKKALGKSKGE